MINLELIIKILTLVFIVVFFLTRACFVGYNKKHTFRRSIKYIIALILFFFYFKGYFDFAILQFDLYLRLILGILVILLGMSLFFWAHYYLGKNWSPILEKKFSKSKKLIKSGPYYYLRHPIYTASFITLLGFFILTANWMLTGIPLIVLVLFYMYKMPREEKELINNFGKEYLKYKKNTGGLIPKIK